MQPVMVSESDLKWVQERQKTKSQGLIWTVYTSANHSADQIWKKVQLKTNLEETKICSQYANIWLTDYQSINFSHKSSKQLKGPLSSSDTSVGCMPGLPTGQVHLPRLL